MNLKPPRARTSAKKLFHPVVDGRLTQYSAKHLDYVDAARRAGRDLTEQEAQVASRAAQAGPGEDLGAIRADDASINHVVAAGTGQNTLNTSIAQFAAAKRRAAEHGDDPGRLRQSIGAQAAAVGRMQMYSRAIAHENLTPEQRNAADHRDRPGLHRDLLGAADQGRNQSLQRLLAVLQGQRGTREAEYRTLLKTTFDSPGNLRVGDAGLNGMISTGFDAEADGDGGMAARSRRLLAAHRAARPDHDDQIFSTLNGEVMSSSRAQVNTRKRKRPDDGVQTPGSEDATEHRHKRARPSPVADPRSRPQ